MVVGSDRAGAVVTCPNCRRSLKVPSGKDRGVEIPAAPASGTRTSRRCQRCGKDVPVDSQMCPHCKAIIMEPAGGPVLTATPVSKGQAAARPSAGTGIMYGGARGGWFSRLSSGGKAGVVIGVVVGVILVGIIGAVIYSSYSRGQLMAAREGAKQNLKDGRTFEALGRFDEAYQQYSYTDVKRRLRESEIQADRDLAAAVEARYEAFKYLAPEAHQRGSVYWKPHNQAEFDRAIGELKASYPTYRQWILSIADAARGAIQVGKAAEGQAQYDAKVREAMDAYVRAVGQLTPQQIAQTTFQTLLQGLKELTAANRHWNDVRREQGVIAAEQYFEALRERVTMNEYGDAVWGR
jgi:hypothetical protein